MKRIKKSQSLSAPNEGMCSSMRYQLVPIKEKLGFVPLNHNLQIVSVYLKGLYYVRVY